MRIDWIDTAKGLGILLVTVGHTNARHLSGDYVGHWINCFHMPLFFFVAGYCFDSSRYPTFFSYFKRKLLSLGWPFLGLSLFCALASVPFYWGSDESMSLCSQLQTLLRLDSRIGAFWFLKMLFEVEIVYWILSIMLSVRFVVWVSVFVLVGGILLVPQGIQFMQWNTMIVSLGYYGIGQTVKNYGILEKLAQAKCSFVSILGCLVMYSIMVFYFHPKEIVGYFGMTIGNPVAFIMLSFLGISGVMVLSVNIVKFPIVGSLLVWMGVNSVILLAVHGHCGLFAASWCEKGFCSVGVSKVLEYLLMLTMTVLLAYPLNSFVRVPRPKTI